MAAPSDMGRGDAFRELTPRRGRWECEGESVDALSQIGERNSVWTRGRFRVISSAVPHAELPRSGGRSGPTWHVSISRRGRRRPTDEEVRRILAAFGMRGADEDNHHPGRARHFFLPVDPRFRSACECKADERVVREPDGFRWTTPRTGRCRGCDFARFSGTPCPIHGVHAAAAGGRAS